MTMHLEGPWLSTTGKRKGKKKFRNAEQAKQAREQEESWNSLLKRHGVEQEDRKRKRGLEAPAMNPLAAKPYRRETAQIDSLPFTGGVCTKAPDKVYTGDKMIGIGTMHKSNSVPIFSAEDAEAIAKMRRG